jgi:ABC-type molybdate transport system permease subunit
MFPLTGRALFAGLVLCWARALGEFGATILFAGNLDPGKLSFLQRKMTEMVKSPKGDFRDWDAIAAWARELPGKLGV